MTFEASTYRLSDVIEIIGGGTPKRKVSEYWGGDIPWLSVVDFNSNTRFVNDTVEKITKLGLDKSSTKLLDTGQLIISARGTVGCLAQLKKPMAFNQSCYGLTGKKEFIENAFLYYLMCLKVEEIKRKTHGAVFDTVTRETFSHIEVEIPSIPVQRKIAKTLGDLDKKIQLNRQTNQTLEHIAQAIFKSWFVDFEPVKAKIAAKRALTLALSQRERGQKSPLPLGEDLGEGNKDIIERTAIRVISGKTDAELDQLAPDTLQQLKTTAALFPDTLVDSELGEIPDGWEVVKFKQIVEKYIDNRGKTPPVIDFGIPLLEVKHLPENSIKPDLNTKKYVDDDTYNNWFRAHLKADDIIISTVGTIGRICMVPENEKFAIAQNLLGLRFKKEKASPYFMYYQMDGFRFRHDVDARLIVTVQASIKRKDLETIDLLSPPIELQNMFEGRIKPFVAMLQSNQEIELAELRDTLLPKLLSGELSVMK